MSKTRCHGCQGLVEIGAHASSAPCPTCGTANIAGVTSRPSMGASIDFADESKPAEFEPVAGEKLKRRRRAMAGETPRKKKDKSPANWPELSPAAWRSIFGGGAIAVVVLVVLIVVLRFQRTASIVAAHEPKARDYMSLVGFAPPPPPQKDGYLRGKVVTVDRNASVIDDLFVDLPSRLRAMTPDEVGTVVFLNWDRQHTGHTIVRKEPGRDKFVEDLYVYTCSIMCVDRETKRVIASGWVTSQLNKNKLVVDDRSQWRPKAQVLEFLNGLPSR